MENEKTKKKKLAIVGFALSRDQAPFDDPEFEIWTVNNLYRFVPRQDAIFELHTREQIDAEMVHGVDNKTYIEELREMKIPVYMQEAYPDVPPAVKYPLEEVTKEFGVPRKKDGEMPDAYFTNSISFMIALGVYRGFEEIHVYGVDMAVGTEYNDQRPSCEYYLGIARGKGIKIYLPLESDLLRTRFTYGYDEQREDAWIKKMQTTFDHMVKQKQGADNAVYNQQIVSAKYEGALRVIAELEKTWE